MAHSFSPDRAMGVFETILVAGGSPVELDAHLQRLRRSVEELFGAEPPPAAREAAIEHAASLTLGRLRLTVSPRDRGALALEAASAQLARGDVFPAWERAVALAPFELAGGLGAHKWADRSLLERMAERAPGCVPLVLDAGGDVLEASRANVFAVVDEALVTPPADGRLLAGVARARAIAIARVLGIEVREQALPLERLLAAGEAFLTGSLRGVEPVRSVDGTELAPPGATARRLAAEMRTAWIGARCAGGAAASAARGTGEPASC